MSETTETGVSKPAAKGRPLAGLTALRFFAASYVLLFHTRGGVFFRAGYTGVTLFFVLSGFILAYRHPQVLPEQRRRFYIARFARIYPLYLFSYAVMMPYFVRNHPGLSLGYLASASLLYLTLLQTWYPPFHFIISPGSWTLSVELVFYILFPFAIGPLSRVRVHWAKTIAILWLSLVIPAALADFFWIPRFPASEGAVHNLFYLPIFHLGEFLIGMVLGVRFLRTRPVFRGTSVLAAVLLCVAFLAMIGPWTARYNELALNGLMALPFGLLIYCTAGWPSRLMANPLLQIGGEISYAIYLLQFFLVELVQTVLHHARGYVPLRFLLFLLTAYLAYQFIEKPCRSLVLRAFGVDSHPKPIETPHALP